MQDLQKQQGVTLLEIMLVLVIAVLMVTLSLRFYKSYRIDQDIAEMKTHVDMLFLALTDFKRANCIEHRDGDGLLLKPGLLDPRRNPPPANPYVFFDIEAELHAPGYLNRWPFVPNRLIDNDAGENRGYYVQLYMKQESSYLRGAGPDSGGVLTGTNIFWKGVVAVKMPSAAEVRAYERVLGATCGADMDPDTQAVRDCGTPSYITNKEYLVWERLLSLRTEGTSVLTPSLPYITLFNRMYDTYPILDLTSQAKSTEQYYLCGG